MLAKAGDSSPAFLRLPNPARYILCMTSKKIHLAWVALAGLSCASMFAQEKSVRERLAAAYAQYYTPTASGLKSFHCRASIDWKSMLSRFARTEIPDDNPVLIYLNAVHLSVSDDLHGEGALEWTDGTAPPVESEAALKQTREGFQQAVAGFFQSWNAYMNGSMVPLPDSTVDITPSGEGVHLSGKQGDMKTDEDFDKNMLLTQALVVSPEIRVLAVPAYTSTTDGLVVSSVKSQVHQPPTTPETDVAFQIEYAKVDSFQIPSHVVMDIKNVGALEFRLNDCQVSLADWANKDRK
jgi:hypothetical protein